MLPSMQITKRERLLLNIFFFREERSTYTYVNKVEVHVNSLWLSNSYTCISFNIPLLLFTVMHCNNLLDHGSYNQEESQCIQGYDDLG